MGGILSIEELYAWLTFVEPSMCRKSTRPFLNTIYTFYNLQVNQKEILPRPRRKQLSVLCTYDLSEVIKV